MKDLIEFLETEMEFATGSSRERVEEWIETLKQVFPEDIETKLRGKGYCTSQGSSGVVGVTRKIRKTPSGIIHEYWIARYSNPEKPKGKKTYISRKEESFLINKLGECEAFKLACIARFKVAGTIYINEGGNIPCFPTVNYKMIPRNDGK